MQHSGIRELDVQEMLAVSGGQDNIHYQANGDGSFTVTATCDGYVDMNENGQYDSGEMTFMADVSFQMDSFYLAYCFGPYA